MKNILLYGNDLLTNRISKYLNEYAVPNKIISDIKSINNTINNKDTIVLIFEEITGDIEIIYPLRSTSLLAEQLSNNLDKNNIKVEKYYQQRLDSDTSKDKDTILRDIGSREGLIIRYSKSIDIDELAKAISNTFINYANKKEDIYIVKKDDTLYSIANKYKVSVDSIKRLNNLGTNMLSIGQKLKIPSNSKNYTVKSGDTLYNIAKKYNISVDTLKKNNNLSSDLLTIGQILSIPDDDDIVYTVKSGDSLYSIAHKYGISVPKLMEKNHLNTTLLSIGQKLYI